MSPANKLALALAVLATVLISATCVSGKAHSANLIELAQVLAPRTDEAAGSGGDSDRPLRTRITADLLIPGRGEPFEPGVVLVEGDTIIYAGSEADAPTEEEQETQVEVPVVMPGMWDCHTHYRGEGTRGRKLVMGFYPEKYIRFANALVQVKESLYAGITSVRELGGAFSEAIAELIASDQLEGPHFHYAGRYIGMTGGHTDKHILPVDVVMSEEWEGVGALCDGVPACLTQVRLNLRQQADIIKVMTSGGVLSQYDQATDDQFSPREITAMVDEARRAKRAVAAHAHSHGGIQNAIDCGVYSIEHGSTMDADQARQMAKKGMVYCPTNVVTQVFNATERPRGISELSWKKGQALLTTHHEALAAAIREGVTIVAGTDCPFGCASVGMEVVYLHELQGMTHLEAIETATANGPTCMGDSGKAPKTGQLREGYMADIIALDASPLGDLRVLTDEKHVTHVWKAGKLYKHPKGERAFGPFLWEFSQPSY